MLTDWRGYDWDTFFYRAGFLEPLPRRKADRPGGRWLSRAVAAFDIETSRIDLPIPKGAAQNSHSFLYVWQFQIEENTIMGRTWDEFKELVDLLKKSLQRCTRFISGDIPPRLIIWVHNLSYEWQYMQGVFPFRNEDVFLRDARKPIYCRLYDVLEFRCSYIQTNMSLLHLTEELQVETKLSGAEFDYNRMRYPWTELTDYEKEYCIRDVRSLVACMKKRMEKDGDTLQTIPYTSTGYVRRDCKESIKDKPTCFDVRDMKPMYPVYHLLRQAFRGGNTHGNRAYIGKVLDNVVSYDMTSCYPAQQLTKRFPMKPFKFLTGNLELKRVLKYVGLGYAVVARYIFENIRLKKGVTIPYLSLARTRSADFVGGIDNGRILYAGTCVCVLTEIDLEIVDAQYEWDTVKVDEAMISKKGYLPEKYRDVIKKYYRDKTELKGAESEEDKYRYAKSKALLNAVFGMSCQDPLHSEILYDNSKYTVKNLNIAIDSAKARFENAETKEEILAAQKQLDEAIQKADDELIKAAFPYQWGVYVTAYARKALQEAIDIAGDRMVYCDTDSVKVIGDIDLVAVNAAREKKALAAGAVARDREGVPHYMGVFEKEGVYDRFVTLGAKRYCYEQGGKLHITVAGVVTAKNPETGVPLAVEELGSIENFREGFVWSKSAGNMSVFNDKDNFEFKADDGSGKKVMVTPNVAIIPTTYEMKMEKHYKTLLQDIELYGEYIDRRE